MKSVTCHVAGLARCQRSDSHIDLKVLHGYFGCAKKPSIDATHRAASVTPVHSRDPPIHRRPKPTLLRHHARLDQPLSMSQFLIFGKDHQDNALKTVLKSLNRSQGRAAEHSSSTFFRFSPYHEFDGRDHGFVLTVGSCDTYQVMPHCPQMYRLWKSIVRDSRVTTDMKL